MIGIEGLCGCLGSNPLSPYPAIAVSISRTQ
jgi:hypothetical protein